MLCAIGRCHALTPSPWTYPSPAQASADQRARHMSHVRTMLLHEQTIRCICVCRLTRHSLRAASYSHALASHLHWSCLLKCSCTQTGPVWLPCGRKYFCTGKVCLLDAVWFQCSMTRGSTASCQPCGCICAGTGMPACCSMQPQLCRHSTGISRCQHCS